LFRPINPAGCLMGKIDEVFSKFISWPKMLLFVFTQILPTIEFMFGVEPEKEDIIFDIFSRSVILSIELGNPPLNVLIFFNLSISWCLWEIDFVFSSESFVLCNYLFWTKIIGMLNSKIVPSFNYVLKSIIPSNCSFIIF